MSVLPPIDTSPNVIHLFGPPPAIDGAPSVERGKTCYPHSPVVDSVSRTVKCRRCEQQLDPVDVLITVSRQHEDYKRMLEETSTMRKQFAALEAEEKRVKARTKAASRKDAQAAVEEEREREGLRRQQTAEAAKEIARLSERILRLARTEKAAEFDEKKYWRQRALSAEKQVRELSARKGG
jgi:hypothetical protein